MPTPHPGVALVAECGWDMSGLEQRVVASASDAIVVADRRGIVQYWNVAAEDMFGFTADKALGSHLNLIIPEKHRQAHAHGYDKVARTGETKYAGSVLSVPAITADGSRIIVEFTVTLLFDASATVEFVAAIMRDITERSGKTRR